MISGLEASARGTWQVSRNVCSYGCHEMAVSSSMGPKGEAPGLGRPGTDTQAFNTDHRTLINML